MFRDTQYRLDYPGYDAKKHHRPPAMAPKGQQYVAPVEKMDSLTVTQVIFMSISYHTSNLIAEFYRLYSETFNQLMLVHYHVFTLNH